LEGEDRLAASSEKSESDIRLLDDEDVLTYSWERVGSVLGKRKKRGP